MSLSPSLNEPRNPKYNLGWARLVRTRKPPDEANLKRVLKPLSVRRFAKPD